MSRTYTARFAAVTFSAQMDFFEIAPADDKIVRILGFVLGQTSDVGDAASENVPIKIVRLAAATTGSGGASPTVHPLNSSDPAFGGTVETGNTTIATSGSGEAVLWEDVWNIAIGYQIWFPEGCQPVVKQGDFACIRSYGAPADALTTHGTVLLEEI